MPDLGDSTSDPQRTGDGGSRRRFRFGVNVAQAASELRRALELMDKAEDQHAGIHARQATLLLWKTQVPAMVGGCDCAIEKMNDDPESN